jgi:hypothetical protein
LDRLVGQLIGSQVDWFIDESPALVFNRQVMAFSFTEPFNAFVLPQSLFDTITSRDHQHTVTVTTTY